MTIQAYNDLVEALRTEVHRRHDGGRGFAKTAREVVEEWAADVDLRHNWPLMVAIIRACHRRPNEYWSKHAFDEDDPFTVLAALAENALVNDIME